MRWTTASPSAGAGNTWVNREGFLFRTGYGVSFTRESFTLEGASNYAGYQFFYNLNADATENTSIESNMTFDGSFEEGSNFRFDWYNGATVSFTEYLALKASLRLVYRGQPALEEIDLENADGVTIGEVVVEKLKLDTTFTTSLVINF